MRVFKSSYNSMMSSSTTIALLYTLCLHFLAFSCVLFSSLFYMPFTLLSSFSLCFKALMTYHSLFVTFTMYCFFSLCFLFLFSLFMLSKNLKCSHSQVNWPAGVSTENSQIPETCPEVPTLGQSHTHTTCDSVSVLGSISTLFTGFLTQGFQVKTLELIYSRFMFHICF